MRVTLESTDTVVTIDGVPCRIWQGHTDGRDGVAVIAFMHHMAAETDGATAQQLARFERELAEHKKIVTTARNLRLPANLAGVQTIHKTFRIDDDEGSR